ncbi:hypothetical protein QUF72_09550 [Desulfobacterales bacterium HSG2]|nr:hypothetical protein [Desulfobacterales bacterium HSG2]
MAIRTERERAYPFMLRKPLPSSRGIGKSPADAHLPRVRIWQSEPSVSGQSLSCSANPSKLAVDWQIPRRHLVVEGSDLSIRTERERAKGFGFGNPN